jgi:hypothetical protein
MTGRECLPNRRASTSFDLECHDLCFTCTYSCFADGRIGEIFLTNHKAGRNHTRRGRRNIIGPAVRHAARNFTARCPARPGRHRFESARCRARPRCGRGVMTRLDPRLVFLARAGARHMLVRAGEMTLGQAIAGLIDGLERCPLCGLRRYLTAERWERTHPPLKYRRRTGAP